ncbi:hypothetical protein MMC28_007042 [Mycoblastus sanguinarius]|nr:hypothetical protein [Mycoblastus sanguinarius]
MASNSVDPNLPALPAEIWRMVFLALGTEYDDLIYQWTECRHVSRSFKEDIEHIFLSKHLPMISILFHVNFKLEVAPEYPKGHVWTEFSHLSEDKTKILFKAQPEEVFPWTSLPDFSYNSRSFDNITVDERWRHRVRIGERYEDIRVPGLELVGRGEFGFEWRELLTKLFMEAKRNRSMRRFQVHPFTACNDMLTNPLPRRIYPDP